MTTQKPQHHAHLILTACLISLASCQLPKEFFPETTRYQEELRQQKQKKAQPAHS